MADSEEGLHLNDREKTFVNSLIKRRKTGNIKMDNTKDSSASSQDAARVTTSDYCAKLQEWMWQYYYGYVNWQNWMAISTFSFPPCFPAPATNQTQSTSMMGLDTSSVDIRNWYSSPFLLSVPPFVPSAAAGNVSQAGEAAGQSSPTAVAGPVQQTPGPPQRQQQNGNVQQPGREYSIPSPFQRFLAEMVDFFILFFIKATIIISIMHLSGMKDVSKFAMHFIVEEIDEDTSMEELQKMMLVALVYRILVCFYEIICIWGAGGATPGKFLIGLRVVTCDTSVLVQPNRVLVVPATNVTLSASTVRALNKNFSIAFFFPAFITLLFFQHNRTVYDIVAGTIVVKRNRVR